MAPVFFPQPKHHSSLLSWAVFMIPLNSREISVRMISCPVSVVKKKAHLVHLLTALLKDVGAIMTGLYMWVGTRRRLLNESLTLCVQMGVRHYS